MVIVLNNINLLYLYLIYVIVFVYSDVLLFSTKEKLNDTADSITAVKKIILNDSGEGYKPAIPSIDI